MVANKKKSFVLWIRVFCLIFFSSFVSIAICVAILVASGMFQEMKWAVFSLSFMLLFLKVWLSEFALKQLYVCLFIAILLSTKRVLDVRAKGF